VQAWDSAGQPAVQMAKDSGRAEGFNRSKGFVPLAMAVASTTKYYREKLSLEALNCVSSLRLLREAERFCRIFPHLSFLTHTFSCPQEES